MVVVELVGTVVVSMIKTIITNLAKFGKRVPMDRIDLRTNRPIHVKKCSNNNK